MASPGGGKVGATTLRATRRARPAQGFKPSAPGGRATCVRSGRPDHSPLADEPQGYVAWHEWAEVKSRSHVQSRCSACGKYAVWHERLVRVPGAPSTYRTRDGRYEVVKDPTSGGEPGGWGYTSWLIYDQHEPDDELRNEPVCIEETLGACRAVLAELRAGTHVPGTGIGGLGGR